MRIDIKYDASVSKCPEEAAFKACVQGVAKFYDSEFSDPITLHIDVGWGEVDGQSLPANSGAASISNYDGLFTYAQVRAAVVADATTAYDRSAISHLPVTDPAPAGKFSMTTAEAKALGLAGASNAVDGYVGIDSATHWVFNTSNTAGSNVPNGDADAFSFLAHEFSEVMGRQMNFGAFPGDIGGGYYPEDLFDYTASGVRSFKSAAKGRYFSINGGVTDLKNFNSNPEGDLFDWAPGSVPDSYDWEGSRGAVSATDLRVLDVLGYDPINISAASTPIGSHADQGAPGTVISSTPGGFASAIAGFAPPSGLASFRSPGFDGAERSMPPGTGLVHAA